MSYDLRFAIRSLMQDRGFTATAVVTLALAIGLNVAVFAVVNTMLFRGFPLVKGNQRLLYWQERYTLPSCCLLYPDFLAWRGQAKSFQGMALVGGKQISLRDGASTRDTQAVTVTANAFRLLGIAPLLGRDFLPADEVPGAPPALMLTYRAWVERFGKRPDIIGHSVTIDKAPATVIGVMPEGFDFPEHGLFWMPLQPTPEMLQGKPSGYMAFGRLADGASQRSAQAELDRINQRLEAEFPATNKGVRARLFTFSQFELGPEASMIYGSVWAAALFVLLIACANLANLTLARTFGRSHEFATRMALGAGYFRIVRQIFTESLILAAAGGAIGWWLARWGVKVWADRTWSEYVVLDYSIGTGMLVYLAGISLTAALLFGSIPIVNALRLDIGDALKAGSRSATVNRSNKRVAAVLVAAQMALAIVLLAGAGVLARSLWNIVGAETGVQGADKVLVGRVSVPREDYPTPDARNIFWDRLRASLTALPGVASISFANTIPVANPGSQPFELDGAEDDARQKRTVIVVGTGTGYLHTVGALTISGRDFLDSDRPGSPPVAIVNQSFATQYWPGQNAIGKRIRLARGNRPAEWHTIIGIASNVMQSRPLRDKFVPIVYVPFRQNPSAGAALFVRTRGPAAPLALQVRQAIQAAAPSVELEDYSTLSDTFAFDRDRMDLEHAELGKHAAVAPIFAFIALALAVIGLYAAVADSVGKRTKEIGIRIAIGADASDIRGLILREGLIPVVAGMSVGLAASFGVNRILASQLVGISPADPLTMILTPSVLILVAVVGCLLPGRRASRIDPAVVLRND